MPESDHPAVITIEDIDREAFAMATAVLDDAAQRPRLAERAATLRSDLKLLATQLKAREPAVYAKVADSVSEALLDLKFVCLEQPRGVSLRLNRLMRAQRDGAARGAR